MLFLHTVIWILAFCSADIVYISELNFLLVLCDYSAEFGSPLKL